MKVLVIDENESIQEMMTDMLSTADREVFVSNAIMEAVENFNEHKPDIVFMNARVGGESTERLLKIISKGETPPKIYMIANSKADMIPEVRVDGWLCKPFRSSDITDAVSGTSVKTEKKAISKLKSFFTRKEITTHAFAVKEPVKKDDMKLKFGKSYLFMEHDPVQLRDACRHFADKGDNVLFITSGTVKSVKEIMRNDSIKVRSLAAKEGEKYIKGDKIGSVTSAITSFINSEKSPVIVIDDLHRLIDMNDLNAVLAMINQTVNNSSKNTVTLLAAIHPDILTERDKGLLLYNMTEYEA